MLNNYIKCTLSFVSACAILLCSILIKNMINDNNDSAVKSQDLTIAGIACLKKDAVAETEAPLSLLPNYKSTVRTRIKSFDATAPEVNSDIITHIDVKLFNKHQETFNTKDGREYLEVIKSYLDKYAPEGMFKSAACAQAYTEGGSGKQGVYRLTNNCFGITAGPSWDGYVFSRATKLVYKDYTTAKKYGATDLFRAYDSIEESVLDYVLLINGDYYNEALTMETPREYLAYILNKGYGEKELLDIWLKVIQLYDLEKYD